MTDFDLMQLRIAFKEEEIDMYPHRFNNFYRKTSSRAMFYFLLAAKLMGAYTVLTGEVIKQMCSLLPER